MPGAVRGRDLLDHPVVLQALESVGEDIGGDAFGRGGEFFEALGPHDQVADDEQRPAVAEHIQAARHRTR